MKINFTNKKKFSITVCSIVLALALCFNLQAFSALAAKTAPAKAQINAVKTVPQAESSLPYTNSIDIVANPTKYLNQKVKIRAKFDKFSVLGLDYKPAFRSSEKYITFLIKRDDVINNVVPLSEMKNFMKREVAEKYIDLKPGDEIEYTGTVFSDALSDTWIDVDTFKIIKSDSLEKKPAKTDKK